MQCTAKPHRCDVSGKMPETRAGTIRFHVSDVLEKAQLVLDENKSDSGCLLGGEVAGKQG